LRVYTKSWEQSEQESQNQLSLHLIKKWRGWDLRVYTKSWEQSEQESQNQLSFNLLRWLKRKMARLGFASEREVLGAQRAGIPEPIIIST